VLAWLGLPVTLPLLLGNAYRSPAFTPKQGQYLAFIYYYTKVNGRPPAEADFQLYFNVSPPTVHIMIVSLERAGLIGRLPGQVRSISLRLPRNQLPDLA
jgi:repressor LexA